MEITKESLTKIKSSINVPGKLDLKIYDTIIDILRNDPLYNNPIKLVKNVDDIKAGVDVSTGILHFNDEVIPYAEEFYKEYFFLPGYNETDAFNYKLIFTLLHELAHLKQVDYAKNDKSIVGKIYREIFSTDAGDEEHYLNNSHDYVFEYNADLEAMRIIREIYNENVFLITLNGMEFVGLILGSYYDGKTNSFLAEKTFKLLDLDTSEVKKLHDEPIDVLVHHGLPVNDQICTEIFNPMQLIKVRDKYNL